MDHRGGSGGDTGRQVRRTVGGHMRRIVMVLAMISGAAPLAAQEPQCASPNTFVQASCQAAVDGVRAFYPLAGMVVTGGNPVIGTAGSLGGLGHFALTARVNAIKAALPDPAATNQTPVPTSFNGAVPAPVIEGAVGVTEGLGGGLLGGDVLGSRAIAGWKLAAVDLAAGIGVDRYKSNDTNIRFYDAVTPTSVRTVVINPTNTRALVFVNGGLSLAAVKLVGEIGLQAGKDQQYVTQFQDFDPKAAHAFGGIGIRFGF